jgi:hypothetical protein
MEEIRAELSRRAPWRRDSAEHSRAYRSLEREIRIQDNGIEKLLTTVLW